MNYELELNDRPFKAIRAGTKKVEGRTPEDGGDNKYDRIAAGDTITFVNASTKERMSCEVLFVRKYPDVRSMLEAEGTKNVLSSGRDIEGGIESYNSLEGYKDNIDRFGIYAIGIKYINE